MIPIIVNGKRTQVDVDSDTPLLWVLRENLSLTGTKFGCGIAQCGACTVHLDGQPIRSCITQIGAVKGKRVTTIEGLSVDGSHPLQQAWIAEEVPQCGYCQSGQIMSAAAMLATKPRPTDCRHRRGDVGEHLPLRHVSAHPARRSPRRGHSRSERCEMSAIVNLSRRGFIKAGIAAGGGLLLGFHVPVSKRWALAATVRSEQATLNSWIRIA